MFKKLKPRLYKNEEQFGGSDFLLPVFRLWLPGAEALLAMIVLHLASDHSITSRSETRSVDDECAQAIHDRNPAGPGCSCCAS
jgi:hypothetical protein